MSRSRSVRASAADVLVAVERGRTTLAAALERARGGLDDERDRSLLFELAAGTLRWQGRLDELIAASANRPLPDLDARVRAVLRLSTYQLEYLDRIPPHAIVHEAVETTRALGCPQAAGFVNAVLRAVARTRSRMPWPSRPGPDAPTRDRVDYLSRTLSHPAWLIERWLSRFAFEDVEAWCRFNNRAPDVTLRCADDERAAELLSALQESGVEAAPARFVRRAVRVPAGSSDRVPPAWRDAVRIQDEASQIVAHVVGAGAGERVLDLCAAPGGKTVVLFDDMGRSGTLVAGDVRPARLRILRAALARAGTPAPIVALDASRGVPFGPVFDRVLLDAPCSGLGTISRDPDIKWTRTAGDLAGFAHGQRAMIAQAAEAVRPGGRLVYATCSSEPEENEGVVDAFLASDPRFSLEAADPGPSVADGGRLVDGRGLFRTRPFRDGLDAYFAAVLVRRGRA